MFNQDEAQKENQITQIEENKFLTDTQKRQRVSTLKSSKLPNTESSLKTVTSLANTMIGSSAIVYPILFVKDGMISSLIILFIIGIINYFTCRLLVVHNRNDESGFNDSILRIGGTRLLKFNNAVNVCLLFIVSIAYFLLVVSNFFQITVSIINTFKHFDPPKTTDINFEQYSFQWASLICLAFCSPLLLRKDIEFVLKLFKYSVYCVIAYGIFILVSVGREISEGRIDFSKYELFSSDFSNVAGTFALSFLIHPVASPILKKNINLNNNERDLLFGYILTAFIYFFVGFMGGLTCGSQVENIYKNPQEYITIFDCVRATQTTEEKIFYTIGKVVQAGIFYQNVTVLPIIVFLTRKEFISLVNKPEKNGLIHVVFTIFFIICSGFIAILAIDVSIVLSFDGAIFGFFISYGIPIYMHLKCYHHKYTEEEKKKRRSLLSNMDSTINEMELEGEIEEQLLKCKPHKKKSKLFHFSFYGTIILFGIALGVFKIYSFLG